MEGWGGTGPDITNLNSETNIGFIHFALANQNVYSDEDEHNLE